MILPESALIEAISAPLCQRRATRDGKELFYIAADGKLMAVDVKTAPTFEAGASKALFDARIAGSIPSFVDFRYDVTADGKRFLIDTLSTALQGSASAPITVVSNWTAGLKH